MRSPSISITLAAVALLAACDVAPSPSGSHIEVRSAVTVEDGSLRMDVQVDDQDRQVHIADLEGQRAVAVLDLSPDAPSLTLASEAEPECVTDDAIACELTEAALDGTLEALAAELDDGSAFRLMPADRCWFQSYGDWACWLCGSVFNPVVESCIGW